MGLYVCLGSVVKRQKTTNDQKIIYSKNIVIRVMMVTMMMIILMMVTMMIIMGITHVIITK